MPDARNSPRPVAPTVRLVERLYVFWIVSTLLTLCLVLLVALLGRSVITQQTRAIDQLGTRIVELEAALHGLIANRSASGGAGPSSASTRPAVSPAAQPAVLPPVPLAHSVMTQPAEAPRSSVPSETSTPRAPATAPGKAASSDGATLNGDGAESLVQRGRALLRRSNDAPPELADAAAAAALLDQPESRLATLPPSAALDAALVARLLDRTEQAARLAEQAERGGASLREYDELCARLLIDAAQLDAAQPFAERAAASGDPTGRTLLAYIHAARGNLVAAEETLGRLEGGMPAFVTDRVRLGRLLMQLERGDDLRILVSQLGADEGPQREARQLLHAVVSVLDGRLVEALALLDFLLTRQPQDYDVLTWRGVALLQAGQLESAREALAHAERFPQRPEAWYWQGMLELRGGRSELAVARLKQAVGCAPWHAAAWEALATIAFNQGELAQAERDVIAAILANPRRASAEFLLALIHCRQTRRDEAAGALERAFRLERRLLGVAKQTEAITRLFEPAELDALLAATPATRSAAPREYPVAQ